MSRLERVLRVTDLRTCPSANLHERLPRGSFDISAAMGPVSQICADIQASGESALRNYVAEFQGPISQGLRVPSDVLKQAWQAADLDQLSIIRESIRRRRAVCENTEAEAPLRSVEVAPGATVSTRLTPVQRAGLYIPAGSYPLVSTVVMNVVPAQVAGVEQIAVTSPYLAETGYPHPMVMAVCYELGVDEVYSVGGAQAIAMFAYGVPGLCERVDLICGPGNIYVAAAKRYVLGAVGIDSEAGPTEIMVIADETADPDFVAADLISQAEHDVLAASVLVTDSEQMAERVNQAITAQVNSEAAPYSQRSRELFTQALTSEQSAIILARDLDHMVEIANTYAAEHLEIHTIDARRVADRIINAGAIFVGGHSPVPLGDYSAGSTHVLPTSSTARFSSGLTTRSFMRATQIVDYTASAMAEIADNVEAFGRIENLSAHSFAATVRKTKDVS